MSYSKLIFPILLFCLSFYAEAQVQLVEVASGFNNVVKIAHAGDERMFVVERPGVIKIVDATGTVLSTPFLDIDSRVAQTGGQSEQGLLGLAFHPDYSNNGYFYVHYIDNSGNTQIARFSVSGDPNVADATSESTVMSIIQPFGNHNGGEIEFGPDGYLYIGMGDGGSANDPGHRSQDPLDLLGKMLRIDIDSQSPYGIPADNPFVNTVDTLDEIWSLGLRNPWRFSFDSKNGDLWMADVGQWDFEEIDWQPGTSKGGENYGWRCREGSIDNPNVGNSGCGPASDYVEPVFEYRHVQFGACSVTGGFVYRGCTYPDLEGYYLYADYCSGEIWGLRPDGQGGWINEDLITVGSGAWSTFGQDVAGEVYVSGLNSGKIFQITMGDPVAQPQVGEDLGLLSVDGTYETYQWYYNGTLIADATEATYMADGSGDYYVVVSVANGCTYTSNTLLVIITSASEIEGLQSFQISPNPFEEELHLQLVTEKTTDFQLKIYTVDGRIVFEKELSGHGEWKEAIDLSELEAAVYLLHLSNSGKELVRKIVKE